MSIFIETFLFTYMVTIVLAWAKFWFVGLGVLFWSARLWWRDYIGERKLSKIHYRLILFLDLWLMIFSCCGLVVFYHSYQWDTVERLTGWLLVACLLASLYLLPLLLNRQIFDFYQNKLKLHIITQIVVAYVSFHSICALVMLALTIPTTI